MRRITLALTLVGMFGAAALAAGPNFNNKGKGPAVKGPVKKDEPMEGLVAHYFKDPTEWDGKWKEGEKPTGEGPGCDAMTGQLHNLLPCGTTLGRQPAGPGPILQSSTCYSLTLTRT